MRTRGDGDLPSPGGESPSQIRSARKNSLTKSGRRASVRSRYVRAWAGVALPPAPSPCSPPPPSPFARYNRTRCASCGTIAHTRLSTRASHGYTARRRHMWGTSRNRARLYRRHASHTSRDCTAYTHVRAVQTHSRAILIVRLRRVTPYEWRSLPGWSPPGSVCVARRRQGPGASGAGFTQPSRVGYGCTTTATPQG